MAGSELDFAAAEPVSPSLGRCQTRLQGIAAARGTRPGRGQPAKDGSSSQTSILPFIRGLAARCTIIPSRANVSQSDHLLVPWHESNDVCDLTHCPQYCQVGKYGMMLHFLTKCEWLLPIGKVVVGVGIGCLSPTWLYVHAQAWLEASWGSWHSRPKACFRCMGCHELLPHRQ